jgi:nitrogenase molybdenum-iron protein alpha/beta subunit
MKTRERVEPLLGCRLAGALQASSGIDGVVPIVHGPMSCASGHRIIPLFAGREPLVTTTALTEMDIIMGADDRLREAVLKAQDVYHPSLILVILTCATSLTADVMSAMTASLGRETGCPIFVVDGSGIVGTEIDGYRDFLEQFRRYEAGVSAPLPYSSRVSDPALEIAGVSAADFNIAQDLTALQHTLYDALQLKVERVLFHNMSMPGPCTDAKSCVSTYLSLNMGRLWLDDPIPCPAPFGARGVETWLGQVAAMTGREMAPAFRAELQAAAAQIENQREKLRGLRVGIEAGSWWAVGLARFLHEDLGCAVILSSDESARQYQERFGVLAETVVDTANIELIQYFKEFGVDIVFGSSYSKAQNWAWMPFWHPMWHAIDVQQSLMGLDGIPILLSVLNSLETWRNDRKNIHFK